LNAGGDQQAASTQTTIAAAVSPSNARLDELKQYALAKIDEGGAKFGLKPVLLSDNVAAQLHADDMLATRKLSHWTTDGMKPYMCYTLNGGTYAVAQNAAIQYSEGNDMFGDFFRLICARQVTFSALLRR
jgi:uncharacterized protein YkwD